MQRRLACGIATAAVAWTLLVSAPALAQPNVGEIKLLPYNICPNGWLEANGALLPIAENDVLFVLYGTTYGGDGQETFALPDLRGRTPIGVGTGPGLSPRAHGESGGVEEVMLTASQLPLHTHAANASSSLANALSPEGALPASKSRTPLYRSGDAADIQRYPGSLDVAGGSQPHPNLPPYTTLRWCVSLFGVFPSQN
jgi:microcystin-dependent protein